MLFIQRCGQCNGNVPPNCEIIGTDGAGVANADIVLYISTSNDAPCGPTSGVLAFASACQLEATLDRYYTCNVASTIQ